MTASELAHACLHSVNGDTSSYRSFLKLRPTAANTLVRPRSQRHNGDMHGVSRTQWSVFASGFKYALVPGAIGVAFFVLADRWDWAAGWGFLCVCAVSNAGYLSVVQRTQSQLPARARITHTRSESSSRPSLFPYLYVCVVFIGALDGGRFGWSKMPAAFWFTGAALYISAFVVLGWCAAINPYFSTVNRIRPDDTGHLLISSGPYRLVRHPGYLATMSGYVFGTCLMLNSWWAFVPAVIAATRLALAAAAEDRVLFQMLDGYRAYAARVPYRLFPGIW
jgi:protein-S-isoprenylcysteine O-methyltransferase Ste14